MTQEETDQDVGYFSEEVSTFGDRAAAARRAMGLTQESLSRKLGIKFKTLRAWEEDMSEPRANKLQMLAGVLNISIIWLLTGEGEGVRDPWDQDVQKPDEAALELVAEIRKIRADCISLTDRLVLLEKKLVASQRR